MTPGIAIIAGIILIFGVVVPVISMIADECSRSPYGSGAARKYLAALVKESQMWPAEYAKHGVSQAPWVVFHNIGSRNTSEWKADMAKRISAIAPEDVSISDAGTCICMAPK